MNRTRLPIDFDRLVRDHQDAVMALGFSAGLRGADLDDASAESFAAVFRALPSFRNESALGTWVYRIAWRTVLKARGRRVVVPGPDSQDEPWTDTGPAEEAEISETSRALWSAVQALDPVQSAVVEMYYRRDWPVQAIADVLGCPAGTVKTHLFRARAELRGVLARLEVFP